MDCQNRDIDMLIEDYAVSQQQLLKLITIYSEDKGDTDTLKLLAPLRKTVDEFVKHAKSINDQNYKVEDKPLQAYCEIKKQILDSQVKIIAKELQGRAK